MRAAAVNRNLLLLGFLWLATPALCQESRATETVSLHGTDRTANGTPTPIQSSSRSSWAMPAGVRWMAPLPGPSSAQPLIWENQIFTSSTANSRTVLSVYSADNGKPLWQRTVSTKQLPPQEDPKYLAPNLVTNGKIIIATTPQGEVACYQLDGSPLWKVNLAKRINRLRLDSGYSSTPILHGNQLFFQWIHGDGNPATHEAYVICLDAKDGSTLWKKNRSTGAQKECEQSYASPILLGEGKQAVFVSYGADYAIAHRTTDGHEIWRIGGLNSIAHYRSSHPFVTPPVTSDGILILPAARRGTLLGLDLTGKLLSEEKQAIHELSRSISWGPQRWGNRNNKPKQIWRITNHAPGAPAPLIHEGLVYLCYETGYFSCHDAFTGKKIYRIALNEDTYHASPILADGKIYLTSIKGIMTVVKTGREFKILSKIDLGGTITATPLIHNGMLYLRSFQILYAIDIEQISHDVSLLQTAG